MAEAEGMPSRQALEKAGLGDGSAYGFSKACANTWTLIQARMLPQHLVNACTPGFIETEAHPAHRCGARHNARRDGHEIGGTWDRGSSEAAL